jgi:F-type H+-transporting ATPase subunit epsilon
MGAYWRVAGMTYVKYANLCADVVRSVLKEPHLTKSKLRENVYFKTTPFVDGKAQPSVLTEIMHAK